MTAIRKTWPPQSAHSRRLRDNFYEMLPRVDAGIEPHGTALDGLVNALMIELVFALACVDIFMLARIVWRWIEAAL